MKYMFHVTVKSIFLILLPEKEDKNTTVREEQNAKTNRILKENNNKKENIKTKRKLKQ